MQENKAAKPGSQLFAVTAHGPLGAKKKQALLRILGDSIHVFVSRKRQRRSSLISHRNLGHLTEETLHVKSFSGPPIFGGCEEQNPTAFLSSYAQTL